MSEVELTKKKRDLLLDLSNIYRVLNRREQRCIYRDFGNYDIEINVSHRKDSETYIFLWEKGEPFKVVKVVHIFNSNIFKFEKELDNLIDTYISKSNNRTHKELLEYLIEQDKVTAIMYMENNDLEQAKLYLDKAVEHNKDLKSLYL